MKSFFACASLLVLTVILFGCEGHVRTLYLKENKNVKAPWSLSSKSIILKSNKDVYAEIATIAKNLSLNKNPNQKNVYYRDDFFMFVNKKSNGLWEIGLKDWPESSRSEISKKTEKLIREKLGNK
jgi:23S rRNA-/tRNA-specific pseudouridylate synthase